MGRSQSSKCCDLKLAVVLATYAGIALCESPTFAQIQPDTSLENENSVVTSSKDSYLIEGGATRGSNLFHSFERFSVPTNTETYFNNSTAIKNIISRVTGSSVSSIDGIIRANGTANLFLINPNGIIFGANAALNIGGSFVASTARSMKFADGNQFSATKSQTASLLTISIPIGLQYEGTAASIDVQGASLAVQPGKTLALVGGNITMSNGFLAAPEGRIELGSVTGLSLVSLNPVDAGWALGYENVEAFQNIELSQRSTVDTSGNGSGDIQVQGKYIKLTGGSQISSVNLGSAAGGTLTAIASESIELSGTSPAPSFVNSGLIAISASAGAAGNIVINTKQLRVREQAIISTESGTFGDIAQAATGRGGNLSINASDSIELINGGLLSSQTFGFGESGNIEIYTGSLLIRGDGAGVSVDSAQETNAGNLNISANSIHVENGGKLTATSELSSDGGNINLQNLDLLTLRNNGAISTSAEGTGNGGNINIDTDNLVLAERSNITANAVDGRGGNISVTTQGLFVSPDSKIKASSDRGINGIVEIRRPDVDPSAELVILPADVVDVSGLVAQGCSVGGVASGESNFAITGRGGLPPTPTEATRSELILTDLGSTEKSKTIPTPDSRLPTPAEISNKVNPARLVEATGWVVGSNGEVVLTASVTNDTLNIPWFKPNSCNGT